MSLTSEGFAALSEAEQQRWRHELDPATLDTCGCRSAASALAITSVLTAVVIILAPRRKRAETAAISACLSIGATAASKVSAKRRASIRDHQLRGILTERLTELDASSAT